jgi:flagellin
MDLIDTASSQVSKALGYIGATVNRLQYQETSLSVAKVNTEASYNRIMNADMAYEQLEATKWGILQQTAIAMLAQANMVPQSILGLFR